MWIELTEALIASKVTAPELAAMKTAAKGAGQTGDGILSARIGALARYVRSFCPPSVPRGAGETVPDEAEDVALAILRNRLFARLPGSAAQFYDEHRKSEFESAESWLKAWAREERWVVPPEDAAPADEQATSPTPHICPRPRNFDACDQDGI